MARSLEEMRQMQRNLAMRMHGQGCGRRRNLHCENCQMVMPHVIPINVNPYKTPGVRWECLGCGNIIVEEIKTDR